MKQEKYGLILYLFLMLPPVITLSESIMSIHMHVQMPLLAIAGMLMTPLLQDKFPHFFKKWNEKGVVGMTLVMIIMVDWLIPRKRDEGLMLPYVEGLKIIRWRC